MNKEKLKLEQLEAELKQVQQSKDALWASVKDFGSADYVKTEKAMNGMKLFNNEIKRLEKRIKELS